MGNIDDLLKKSLNRLGIARQVEAVGVVEKATKAIAKYVPREDFEVISFSEGKLKVTTTSSVVASELSYKKLLLLKILNADGLEVSEVAIRVNPRQERI